MVEAKHLVRKGILDLKPYIPGKPIEEVIEESYQKSGARLVWIDAKKITSEIGLPIAENIVMLGAITLLSDFDKELMIEVLKKNVPRQIEKNISAFLAGYKIAEGT